VLEFYSDRQIVRSPAPPFVGLPGCRSAPLPRRFAIVPHAAPFRSLAAYAALGVAALVALSGCATLSPGAPATGAAGAPRSTTAEPPPPAVNLSGFPLPYRQGYADGCVSQGSREQKDAARFSADADYRMGWQDGRSICGRK
jgi:hypothetical protein